MIRAQNTVLGSFFLIYQKKVVPLRGVYTMASRILKNITALGVLQIANYLIPLLVLPIISRVLGATLFGGVGYAQNIVSYLTLIVNYGFEYSATRQIALASNDAERKRNIFWAVISAKTMLLAFSFIILALLTLFIERISCDPRLYIYTALTNIGLVLFPTWYLQGEQQVDKMAWANFFGKLLGATLVIALVRETAEYRLYPLILSLSNIVVGVGSMIYVIRHFHIGKFVLKYQILSEVFKTGFPIFMNNIFVSLYTMVNMTLLGIFATDEVVGYFSAAQRLILAINMIIVLPISTSVYPEICQRFEKSKQGGKQYLKRILILSGIASAIVSLLTFIAAPLVIHLVYGEGYTASIEILQWLSPLPFLVMIATLLTVQGLYSMGLHRYAPWVGATLAVFCISLNLLLLPHLGAKAACLSWILAEVLECLIVGIILLTKGRKPCSI